MIFSDELCREVANEKSATNPNQPHKLHCMPKAEEKPNGNLESRIYYETLPDELVENTLVLATTTRRQVLETYCSLVQACKRLSTILEGRKREIFPGIYLQLPDDEIKKFKKLSWICGKLKKVFEKS